MTETSLTPERLEHLRTRRLHKPHNPKGDLAMWDSEIAELFQHIDALTAEVAAARDEILEADIRIAHLEEQLAPAVLGPDELYNLASVNSHAHDQSEETEVVNAVTAIVREADKHFERVGGGSRHWVRDCFLPTLNANGYIVVPALREAPLSKEPRQ